MMLSVEEPVASSGASSEAAVLDAVARATAQRYLAALVQSGRLELNLRYGARGRPEHRYALPGYTVRGGSQPPSARVWWRSGPIPRAAPGRGR